MIRRFRFFAILPAAILVGGINATLSYADLNATVTTTHGIGTEQLPWQFQIPFAISQRCGTIDLLGFRVTADYSDGSSNGQFDFDFSLLRGASDAGEALIAGEPLIPDIQPCEPPFVLAHIAHLQGTADVYAFHIGAGGPNRQTVVATFNFTDQIEVISDHESVIELPYRIHGSLVAGESLGDPVETVAKGTMALTGTFAGRAFGGSISVESRQIPDVDIAEINETGVVTVPVVAGVNVFDLAVTGTVDGFAQAKSSSLFGLISGASTLAVSTPGSIEVGNFRASGGGPLPAGMTIRGRTSGVIYAGAVQPLAGDFDDDGDVDGDDLSQWKGDFGNIAGSDADGDGDSDGADFLIWQRSFGTTSGILAAAAVPEPAAWIVCAFGLSLLVRRRSA